MAIDSERICGPSTAADDPRITRAARLIRKYKLDELPRHVNVFIGIKELGD